VTKNQFLPPKVRRPREDVNLLVAQAEDMIGLVTAGSYRRQKETIGDLDFLVPPERDFEGQIVELQTVWGYEPARSGSMKSEGLIDWEGSPFLINLWRVPEVAAWGGMLLFATGPYDMNIMMRARAQGQGWKLSQYGLFDQEDKQLDYQGSSVALEHEAAEKSIFDMLGLQYIGPVERETWRRYLLPRHDIKRNVVKVRSSNGTDFYDVDMENGKAVHCSCVGFGYRARCRHLAEAEEIARRG
jgi:DNA polymerase (family 10)